MTKLDDLYGLPGLITRAEVDCLYQLGQFTACAGTIVEIGSWKGKSTIALARGAATVGDEKVHASIPIQSSQKKGT